MALSSLPRAAMALALAALALVPAVSAGAKENVAELEKRTSDEGTLLQFSTGDYNKFLQGSNREYGVFALFTASDPKFNCQQCKPAYDELKLAADSFRRAKGSDDHFYFAVFDFGPSTQKVFQKHEIQNAPLFWYFPAKGGKVAESDKMAELQRKGPNADLFRKFIKEKTGVEFAVKRPVNWVNVIIMVTVFGGLGALLYFFMPVALMLRFAKPLLTIISMVITLIYPTGYMWNQIRGAGWYTRGQNGELETWAKGSGNQTMTESYALFMLHGAYAIVTILLINAPRMGFSKVPGSLLAAVFLAFAMALTAVDWYIYRIHKNSGYPYSFFL